jgi:hypothetical protein
MHLLEFIEFAVFSGMGLDRGIYNRLCVVRRTERGGRETNGEREYH